MNPPRTELPDRSDSALPMARLRRARRRFPLVWLVPLVAALVTGYLLFEQIHELGPMITLQFKDGSGLKPGQTDIEYLGVTVGQVKSVELGKDQRHVVVHARLSRDAAGLAREGSRFWVVRLKGAFENLASLGTVISGPYIEVHPGDGGPQRSFIGLEQAPVAPGDTGLRIIVRASRLADLRPNSPVYYRGVTVGTVQDGQLGNDARAVDIHVYIMPRYAGLVGQGSQFWNVGGIKADFGLFRGLHIDVESLRSLVAGGIAFATPNGTAPAHDGAVFQLHERPNPAWLAWAPRIRLAPEAVSTKGGEAGGDSLHRHGNS